MTGWTTVFLAVAFSLKALLSLKASVCMSLPTSALRGSFTYAETQQVQAFLLHRSRETT